MQIRFSLVNVRHLVFKAALYSGLAITSASISGCSGVSRFSFMRTPTTKTPARLSITGPTLTSFALQSVNSITYRAITVTNEGGAAAKFLKLDGLRNTPYIFAGLRGSFVGPRDACDRMIPAGSSCQLVVGFIPIFGIARADGVTPLTGTFTLHYDDGNNEQSLRHSLTGLADMSPRLYVQDPEDPTAETHDFGLFRIGATASYLPGAYSKELKLQFYGPPGAAVSNIIFAPFASSQPYVYDLSSCSGVSYMTVLNPSCHFKVRFAPVSVAPGGSPAMISIGYSDGGSFGAQSGLPASFSLKGESVGPASLQISSATMLDFGQIHFGTSSKPRTVSVAYTGTLPATDIAISLSGPDAAHFTTQQPATGACVTSSRSLSADCSFVVIFTPDQNRAPYDATLTLSYSDGIGNTIKRAVTLKGAGIGDLTANPSSVILGAVPIGNTGISSTLITNNSTADVTFSSFNDSISASVSGARLSFRIQPSSSTCLAGTLLRAGATCRLDFSYRPLNITQFAGVPVSIGYVNSNGKSDTLALTLTGNGVPNLNVNTSHLDFGGSPVGNLVPRNFVLTNIASNPITLDLNSIPSTLGQFSIQSIPTQSTLAGGASITLQVIYRPTALGATGADISVKYVDTVGTSQNLPKIHLSGTGLPDITASSIAFHQIPVGNTAEQVITVENISAGAVVLDLSTFSLVGSSTFSISGGTCQGLKDGKLASRNSCTIQIRFRPIAMSEVSSELQLSYVDSVGNAYGPSKTYESFRVAISGSAAPNLQAVNPGMTFYFPSVPVGDSQTQTLLFKNVASSSIQITGAPASMGDFSISPSGACTGGTLASGASCSVSVTFKPRTLGSASASAQIIYVDAVGNSNQTHTLELSGSGIANLSATPTSKDFGAVPVGDLRTTEFTLTNLSRDHVINLASVATSGQQAGFNVAQNTCNGRIIASSSCTITVQFQPRLLGVVNSTLGVSYPDPYGTSRNLEVSLGGLGLPNLILSGLHTFPSTPLGGTSSQSVTFSNAAAQPIVLGSFTASGPYSVRAGAYTPCTLNGGSLAGGASCQIIVDFKPAANGTFGATLTADYADSLGQSQSTSLNANGTGFTPAVLALTSPASPYSFSSTLAGSTQDVNFTLSNSGTVSAIDLAFSGGTNHFRPYLMNGNSCPASGCQIGVRFAPDAPSAFGPVSLTLSYKNGADPAIRTLTLVVSGSSTSLATLQLTDNQGTPIQQLDFGKSPLGSAPVNRSVNLINTSTTATASAIAFNLTSSGSPAAFQISSNSCGTSLAPGAKCQIQAQYLPHAAHAAPGAGSGLLNVSFNAGSLQVSLGGASTIRPQLATGAFHSCALSSLGQVFCWGKNDFGQLGIGSRDSAIHSSPLAVNLGSTARAISAGYNHTCAVLQDHSVKCWGDNSVGQLGLDGTAAQNSPAAGAIALGESVKAVTAGNQHTCALLNSGQVKCWGSSQGSGVLGLGTLETWGDGNRLIANLPAVNLGSGITALQISAGYSHTCAVLSNSQLKCWGNNTAGQLGQPRSPAYFSLGGDPTTVPAHLPPINLGGSLGAASVSAANGFTCVVLSDHSGVKCFGRLGAANGFQYGNLGKCWSVDTSGNFVDCSASNNSPLGSYGLTPGQMGSNLPIVKVGSNASVLFVSAGSNHVCAEVLLGSDTRVKCWGLNSSGQLGTGSSLDDSGSRGADQDAMGDALASVVLAGGETLAGLSAGLNHSCVWYQSGKSQCWGLGASGQLGYGNSSSLNAPGTAIQW